MAKFNEKLTTVQDLYTTQGSDVTTAGTITALANTGTSFFRTTLCTTLQGIVADSSGKVLAITNANSVSMQIDNNSGSASAADRIITGTGGNVTLPAGATVELRYDTTAAVWRIINGPNSAGDVTGPASANDTAVAIFNGTTGKIIKASVYTIPNIATFSPDNLANLSVTSSVAANALTISLLDKDGSAPAPSSPVTVNFRSATPAIGTITSVSVTSNVSLVISSGSTLGQFAAIPQYIYVYAINNAGTLEIAASSSIFDDGSIVSTTAEGGAGGADSALVMYSTTARSNVACRLICRITSTQATPGTWATTPSENSSGVFSLNQEGTFTVNFNTGMNTNTNNATVIYRKVGKIVTLSLGQLLVTANATSSSWLTAAAAVPAILRPSTNSPTLPVYTVNNGVGDTQFGYIEITTSGQISIQRTVATWTNGTANSGFNPSTMTYQSV